MCCWEKFWEKGDIDVNLGFGMKVESVIDPRDRFNRVDPSHPYPQGRWKTCVSSAHLVGLLMAMVQELIKSLNIIIKLRVAIFLF